MNNMIYLCSVMALLLGMAMFWCTVLKKTPEESLALSIMSILLLVFAAGVLNVLKPALALLYLWGIVGIVFFLVGMIRRQVTITGFFSPGIMLVLFIFVYATLAFRNMLVCNFDELAQWGKAVRFMLDNNRLAHGASFDGNSNLISSTTFFHYYFCKLPQIISGKISEGNFYISNIVLWFSAVVLPIAGRGWREWKKVFIYGIIIFLSMNFLFVQPYYNIYCDLPVAFWMGALIAWRIGKKNDDIFSKILTVMIILNAALMKSMTGPLFAVIAVVAIIICDIVNVAPENLVCYLKHLKKRNIIWMVLYSLSAVVLTVLWSFVIRGESVARSATSFGFDMDRFKKTVYSGIGKWIIPVNLNQSFPNISYLSYFVITLILLYFLYTRMLKNKMKNKVCILLAVYSAGFILYFCLMIYAYMTTFTYADSIITGSLHRYFSDYMILGLPLMLCSWIFFGDNVKVEYDNLRVGALVLTVLFCFSTLTTSDGKRLWSATLKDDATYQICVKMQDYKIDIQNLIGDKAKIYMINQSKATYPVVVADYQFGNQIKREGMGYYFFKEGDPLPGLNEYDPMDIKKSLEYGEFEYLWIYKTDSYFNTSFEKSFHRARPENGDLYQVKINENGVVTLSYIANVKKDEEE